MAKKPPQPQLSTFTQHWTTRLNQARALGVKASDFLPVYNLDYTRMLQGNTPYSNQDAWTAIAALSHGKPIVTAPTSSQSGGILGDVAGFLNNVRGDVQGIATGIFHIPATLLHMTEQAVKDPGSIVKPIFGNYKSWHDMFQAYDNAPFWSLVPGVADLANITSRSGRSYMASHPISSLLDLTGFGSSVFGKAGDVARTLGGDSLAHDFYRAAQFRPISTLAKRIAHYTPIPRLIGEFANKFGISTDLTKHLTEPLNVTKNIFQEKFDKYAEPIIRASGDFTPPERAQLWDMLQHNEWDGVRQSFEDMQKNPNIPEKFKAALPHLIEWTKSITREQMARGYVRELTNPVTGEREVVPTMMNKEGRSGNPIVSAVDKYDKTVSRGVDAATKFHEISDMFNAHYHHLSEPLHPFPQTLDASLKDVVDNGSGRADGLSLKNDYAIYEVLGKFAQHFRSSNPTDIIRPKEGWGGKEMGAARRAYYRLWGKPDGTLGKVDELVAALRDHNWETVKKLSLSVKQSLKSQVYKDSHQVAELNRIVDMIREDTKGVIALHRKVIKAQLAVEAIRKGIKDQGDKIEKMWPAATGARYEAYINRLTQQKVLEVLSKGETAKVIHPADMAIVVQHITSDLVNPVIDGADKTTMEDYKDTPLLSPKEAQRIKNSVMVEYRNLVADGIKPVWLPKVKPGDGNFRRVHISPTHNLTPDVAKRRALNMAASIHDPFVGLVKTGLDMYSDDATRQYFENHVRDRLTPGSKLQRQYQDEYITKYFDSPHSADMIRPSESEFIELRMKEDGWTIFNFDQYMKRNNTAINPFTGPGEWFIQKTDQNHLERLIGNYQDELMNLYDKSINLYRFAVLGVSPRFAAHIIFGGGFLTLANTGVSVLRFLPDAIRMVKNHELPPAMARGVSEADLLGHVYEPLQFHQYLGGKKMWQLYADSIAHRLQLDHVAGAVHAWQTFLEHVSNTQRSMSYLYGKNAYEKAAKKGIDTLTADEHVMAVKYGLTDSQYAGIKVANNTLANLNNLTPFERSVVKKVMPFYGWTKHIIRFMARFPIDHPLRANILSNLANQSLQENQLGIPTYLYHLFFMGIPDANGNINAVDMRQWNPLRDVANYMTMAGFISTLNPVAQGLLQGAGVDTTTGGPQLYPNLQYSAFYGSSQPVQPAGTTGLSLISSYIPEFGLIDHYLKLSSYTKSLAKYNPRAYQQQFWSSLDIPWVPQKYNIPQMKAKEAITQLSLAKTAVNTALSSNDPSQLDGFGQYVPYGGWMISTNVVKRYIESVNAYNIANKTAYPATSLINVPIPGFVPLPSLAQVGS